jgi:hypothetical protein
MKLDYDEKSPITGNQCVLVETDEHTGLTSYMCMESGFTCHEKLTIDSDYTQKYEETITQLMRDVKHIDQERGLVWYPSFIHINGVGMLYTIGNTASDMHWQMAQVVDITGDERLKYPVPGKENEYFTSRLDVENALTFDAMNFENALDALYTAAAELMANNEAQ